VTANLNPRTFADCTTTTCNYCNSFDDRDNYERLGTAAYDTGIGSNQKKQLQQVCHSIVKLDSNAAVGVPGILRGLALSIREVNKQAVLEIIIC
jgi:hypothetical protein